MRFGHRLALTLSPPVRDLRSPPVRGLSALTMRGAPNITYVDVPGPSLEAAHLPEVYPAPVFAHLDLVTRAHPDSSATLLQHRIFSTSDDPFANPLPITGPHTEPDLVLPVIGDENVTPRPIGANPGRYSRGWAWATVEATNRATTSMPENPIHFLCISYLPLYWGS